MKAYRVEVLIIDIDECGSEGITTIIENTKYPNYCISPMVRRIESKDIGEWHDEHPLNQPDGCMDEWRRLFPER